MLSSAPTSPPPGGPPRICNVATRCVSREDFLRSFAPFVDEDTLFIPTKLSFEIGQRVRFQVSLADGTVVLAGLGEASELLASEAGPLGKSGVRFFIRSIDESSRTLRDELAARRRHAVGAGVAGVGVTTSDRARMTRTMGSLTPDQRPPAHPSSFTEPKSAAAAERPGPRAVVPSARAVFGSERRADKRLEATQEFVPHFPVSPSPGARPVEHDPLAESTLSASEPLEGERTRDDLQAEALLLSENRQELPRAERPAQGPPAELSPPAVQVLTPPPHAARDTGQARTAHVSRGLRAERGWRSGTTVLAAAAGVLVAFLFWMRANRPHEPEPSKSPVATAPVPPPEAEPLTSPVPPAEPKVAPAPAAPVAPASERPAGSVPTAERRAAPGHRCEARIESQPRGATVMLGQTRLGRTPLLRAVVPCGASVTISHPRYLPATVDLEGTSEAPVMVSARLSRPGAQLQLSSAPEGALFRVNGSQVGRGPRQVTVSRFESVRVEARLPGQRPWVRKIYLKEAVTEVKAVFNATAPARRRNTR